MFKNFREQWKLSFVPDNRKSWSKSRISREPIKALIFFLWHLWVIMHNIYPAAQGRNFDATLNFDFSLSSTLKSTVNPYQIYNLKSSGIFQDFSSPFHTLQSHYCLSAGSCSWLFSAVLSTWACNVPIQLFKWFLIGLHGILRPGHDLGAPESTYPCFLSSFICRLYNLLNPPPTLVCTPWSASIHL